MTHASIPDPLPTGAVGSAGSAVGAPELLCEEVLEDELLDDELDEEDPPVPPPPPLC
jgi:hypothetical protein